MEEEEEEEDLPSQSSTDSPTKWWIGESEVRTHCVMVTGFMFRGQEEDDDDDDDAWGQAGSFYVVNKRNGIDLERQAVYGIHIDDDDDNKRECLIKLISIGYR